MICNYSSEEFEEISREVENLTWKLDFKNQYVVSDIAHKAAIQWHIHYLIYL